MSYFFTKRYHPPGTTPGTLTSPHREHKVPVSLRLVTYNKQGVEDKAVDSISECRFCEFAHICGRSL